MLGKVRLHLGPAAQPVEREEQKERPVHELVRAEGLRQLIGLSADLERALVVPCQSADEVAGGVVAEGAGRGRIDARENVPIFVDMRPSLSAILATDGRSSAVRAIASASCSAVQASSPW